jgi:hypothetical protein
MEGMEGMEDMMKMGRMGGMMGGGGMGGPPVPPPPPPLKAKPNKDEMKYINCEVCQTAVKQLSRQAEEMKKVRSSVGVNVRACMCVCGGG